MKKRYKTGRNSAYVDLSAPHLSIAGISKIIGLKATHWYTPRGYSPEAFYEAKYSSDPVTQRYCWQYRTMPSDTMPPQEHLDLIIETFKSKKSVLIEASRKYNAPILFGIMMETNESLCAKDVYFSQKAIKFMSSVNAHCVVDTLWYDKPSLLAWG